MTQKRACVFLDRDGVINTGGLINSASDLKLIPGAARAIASLKKAGYLVGICTNQGGLSEDFDGNVVWKQRPLNREKLAEIHAELSRQLGAKAQPDFIKICPHAKKIVCTCRKPKGGMLTEAGKEFDVDMSRSFMVGDMATDVLAGIDAGVAPLFVLSGFEPEQKDKCPAGTLVFPSLKEAAAHIIKTGQGK
ncbi:MAG: HAD-IIIA family hydrolase [Cyanobacteria bacterium SZAS LIN-3]|nr:HAD-IIIA family hydrolase [Cyanobacteria bacterium SZAS LIN-3]MBS2007398.1 HAD-IIIA family hydrolase [Cyanobacteria bacterium SZAS TMP-1]